MKSIAYVRERFSKDDFPVFCISDVKSALKGQGISEGYVRLMLHNLKERGEIKTITKGIYSFHDDIAIVGFAFQPFYYGLECALSIRGISEQGTNIVVMTPRNVRAGMRNFGGRNYRVQRLDKRMMFGFDLMKYGNFWVPVSDLEKTIIDMLYFRDYISEELWKELIARINLNKLKLYLTNYNIEFGKEVLLLVSKQTKNHIRYLRVHSVRGKYPSVHPIPNSPTTALHIK
jgi:predicted transcriptional regulator of viral defense system